MVTTSRPVSRTASVSRDLAICLPTSLAAWVFCERTAAYSRLFSGRTLSRIHSEPSLRTVSQYRHFTSKFEVSCPPQQGFGLAAVLNEAQHPENEGATVFDLVDRQTGVGDDQFFPALDEPGVRVFPFIGESALEFRDERLDGKVRIAFPEGGQSDITLGRVLGVFDGSRDSIRGSGGRESKNPFQNLHFQRPDSGFWPRNLPGPRFRGR